MTEDEVRASLVAAYGSAALERLDIIARAVAEEADRQNLVARSTLRQIWMRHILDSAQLLTFSRNTGLWLDVGTGGGFPGLVVAALSEREIVLCEPRRLRAEFLRDVVERLDIQTRVRVEQCRVELLTVRAATISARAVASVSKLVTIAANCASSDTEWILPRGVSGRDELASLPRSMRSMFHVEQSQSDRNGVILVGRGLTR